MRGGHQDGTARVGHFAGRGRLTAWAAAGVMAISLGAAGCGGHGTVGGGGRPTGGGDRETRNATDFPWAAGITPKWMGTQMGLSVPTAAKSPQAAYKVAARFDTGLLTFTLSRSEAEAFLRKNPPKGTWLEPTAAATDVEPHDFAHFGLPEPETFKDGLRYGYTCPSTGTPGATGSPSGATEDPFASSDVYDMSDERCVRVYAHEYAPDRTRIYLRAHFEPGISDLPVTAAPSPS